MLRARIRTSTGNTGVRLSVSHMLGVTADVVWWVPRNRYSPGTYLVIPNNNANIVHIVNSLNSNVSLDMFVWAWQGRLY